MSLEDAMPLKFMSVLKVHKGALKSRSLHLLLVHDQPENGLWDDRKFKEGLSTNKLEEATKLERHYFYFFSF